MAFQIVFTKCANKELDLYEGRPALQNNLNKQLAIIVNNPFQPPCKSLGGDMKGLYSRRINRQHRLVYRIEHEKIVIVSVWDHY